MLLILNGLLLRLIGNLSKVFSFIFHILFPKKRFIIPEFSPAKFKLPKQKITPVIYQTNYSNRVTLPIYLNYLVNRLFSLNYDYRYISTEKRLEIITEFGADELVKAYCQLTDGASQADFWRVFMLNQFGGVYLDIDAQLVTNLSKIIKSEFSEVLITRREKYTNFFMASEKNNPILQKQLEIIIDNIQNRRISGGVFVMTGPDTLNKAIAELQVFPIMRRDKITCAQGTFTNEYFQYIDKPGSKWCYKSNEELLKDNKKAE